MCTRVHTGPDGAGVYTNWALTFPPGVPGFLTLLFLLHPCFLPPEEILELLSIYRKGDVGSREAPFTEPVIQLVIHSLEAYWPCRVPGTRHRYAVNP